MSKPRIYQFKLFLGSHTNTEIVIANSIEEINNTYLYASCKCSPLILITQKIRNEFNFTGYEHYNKELRIVEELKFDAVGKLYKYLVFNNKLEDPYYKIIIELFEIIMINWDE